MVTRKNTCKLHNGHSENQVIRIVCKRDKQSLIYSDWWVLTQYPGGNAQIRNNDCTFLRGCAGRVSYFTLIFYVKTK